jgi:hypothetical protein
MTAYATGTLGTTSATVLTPAMLWGIMPTTGYGAAGSTGGVATADYAANYHKAITDLNVAFQYSDSYDPSNETYDGPAVTDVTRQWAALSNGILYYPGGRGMLKLYPGDVIACDPNTGWPVLINNASALYTGGGGTSSWELVPNV